jgi:hypothetical protein
MFDARSSLGQLGGNSCARGTSHVERHALHRGEHVLFEDVRYFFYLTNDWSCSAAQIVSDANDRCAIRRT